MTLMIFVRYDVLIINATLCDSHFFYQWFSMKIFDTESEIICKWTPQQYVDRRQM